MSAGNMFFYFLIEESPVTKNQYMSHWRPISQKRFLVGRPSKKHKYGPCSGLATVKTASEYLKGGILEKIFLTWGVKIEKNAIFCKTCQRCLIFQDSRFSLTACHAAMYFASEGISQSIVGDWEIASRVLRTKGGSVKKWVNLTLTLNCAETVCPSDMMPQTENMRQCIFRSMVKTASFHLKS